MTNGAKPKETFEAIYEQLEAIAEALNSADIPLDEAIRRYEEGNELIKKLKAILDEAKNKLNAISEK